MFRIPKRAGLTPWPKLFHDLRASRETAPAAVDPIHVVCAWVGNIALIAARHYLQVTEDYFEHAAQGGAKAAQQPAAGGRTPSQDSTQGEEVCELVQDDASSGSPYGDKSYAWRDSNPQPMAP